MNYVIARNAGKRPTLQHAITIPIAAAPGSPWTATRAVWHLDCWLAEVLGPDWKLTYR